MTEYTERDAISSLATRESDIAIIREELLTVGQFDVVSLFSDYLAFFCDSSHPLAAQYTVTIDQIANEPLALPPDSIYMGRYSMELFRKNSKKNNIIEQLIAYMAESFSPLVNIVSL